MVYILMYSSIVISDQCAEYYFAQGSLKFDNLVHTYTALEV